jgi:hypothetical protein
MNATWSEGLNTCIWSCMLAASVLQHACCMDHVHCPNQWSDPSTGIKALDYINGQKTPLAGQLCHGVKN